MGIFAQRKTVIESPISVPEFRDLAKGVIESKTNFNLGFDAYFANKILLYRSLKSQK